MYVGDFFEKNVTKTDRQEIAVSKPLLFSEILSSFGKLRWAFLLVIL